MSKVTYTMFVADDAGADEIVARNVTAGQALSIPVERGGAGDARIVCWHDRTHRFYAIVRHPAGEPLGLVMAVRGPLSPDEPADASTAAELLERTARLGAAAIRSARASARERRRREKYPFAFGRPGNA